MRKRAADFSWLAPGQLAGGWRLLLGIGVLLGLLCYSLPWYQHLDAAGYYGGHGYTNCSGDYCYTTHSWVPGLTSSVSAEGDLRVVLVPGLLFVAALLWAAWPLSRPRPSWARGWRLLPLGLGGLLFLFPLAHFLVTGEAPIGMPADTQSSGAAGTGQFAFMLALAPFYVGAVGLALREERGGAWPCPVPEGPQAPGQGSPGRMSSKLPPGKALSE